MSVRVRFAPSPTGYLHVGSLRSALYNYLFARHFNGTFILRIEDTDRTRFVEGAMEEQIESLRWAGIEFDEGPHLGGDFGPYIQSERFDLYRHYSQDLIANGTAYYAFDTPEELDSMRARQQAAGVAPRYSRSDMRNQYTMGDVKTQQALADGEPFVVRLRVPTDQEIRFDDEIRGTVVFNGREVDDQILLKSDGFPTYHLANVVDDHLMKITHVIRAEEWLPSTPKHVLLYEAFGWQPPRFAHVPLMLNEGRTKMSKRHGDVMVRDFRAKGYFPDALLNYVALCGWSASGDQEIYSLEELISHFSLDRVHKAGAVFDYKKLEWMNSEYLRMKSPDSMAPLLQDLLKQHNYQYADLQYIARVIELLRERVSFLQDMVAFGDYLWSDDITYDAEYKARIWTSDAPQLTTSLNDIATNTEPFTAQSLQEACHDFAANANIKTGRLLNTLRLVITGKTVGANVYDTMEVLGRERCLQRLNAALTWDAI